jgi:hypothetical protein
MFQDVELHIHARLGLLPVCFVLGDAFEDFGVELSFLPTRFIIFQERVEVFESQPRPVQIVPNICEGLEAWKFHLAAELTSIKLTRILFHVCL